MSKTIPVQDILLKIKQHMIVIEGLPTKTIIVSGRFLGKEETYYQLNDMFLALVDALKDENGKTVVDIDKMYHTLLDKSVDVYEILKSLDKLIESLSINSTNQ